MRKIEHNRLLLLAVITLLVLTHSSVVDGTVVATPVYDPYKAALMSGNAGSDTGNAVSSSPSVASVVTTPLSTSSTAPIASQSSQSTTNKSSQSSSSDQSVPAADQSQTVQLQIPSPFDGVNSSYLQMTESDYQSLLTNLTVIHGQNNVKGVQVKAIDSAGVTGNFLVIRIVDNVSAASAKSTKVILDSKIAASLAKSSQAASTPTSTPTSAATSAATASSLQASVPPGAPFSSPQASAQPVTSGTPFQNSSDATAQSALAAPVTTSPNFSYMYPPSPAGYPPSMQSPFQPMYSLGYAGASQLPPSQLPPSQLPPSQLPPSQLSPSQISQGAPTYQSNLGQTVPQSPNYVPRQPVWSGYNPYQYQSPQAATYPPAVRYGAYNYQNYPH